MSSSGRSPGRADLIGGRVGAIAGKSNDVVESLGVPYRWITSYVAGDKIYCVHEADDEDAIREHARRGGFPANSVTVVANEFGPHTAAQARETGVAVRRQRVSTATHSMWWVSGNESNTRNSLHRVAVPPIQADVAGE